MQFKISGAAGTPAKVAIKVTPEIGTTIIKGNAPNAELFQSSSTIKEIGKVPLEVDFYILFHRRPWKISIDISAGGANSFTTSSEEQGLTSQAILTPDVLPIHIDFVED